MEPRRMNNRNRRRARELCYSIAAIGTVVLILMGAIYLSTSMPCSYYKYAASKDVPARCLKEFNK